jgi:type I restriction-modification system DNA methylase subunit
MPSKPNPIELEHSVEIYVPTQCRCGQPLPEDIREEVMEKVKTSLYNWFGGVSKMDDMRVEKVEGSWPLATGGMANERVDVVYANSSGEALEEHFGDLPVLAAEIANRLTQESVAFRVDKKMTLIPGEDPKPHRCAGGASPGSLPVARQPNLKDRMRSLQASLQRISSVRDARDLFCNVLHYEFEDEQFATVQWPNKLRECLAPGTVPRIIAGQNGFKILYLQLAEDYVRKGSERQLVQRIIKDDPTLRGLVVVSDVNQKQWHLVNAKFEKEEGKRERLHLRRMRVGPGQSVRTAVERLAMVDIETAGEETTAAELQDLHDRAFDVDSVSREFFNDISNWYFWALSQVEFPQDTVKKGEEEKYRATSLIRFLTRIIFCWFLKEKGLVPESLFREKDLGGILTDLDPDSCTYHQGILHNLFFATLNQRMGKDSKGQPYRAFAKDEGFLKNKTTYGVDTLYRYEEHFQNPEKALSYFAEIPFLNGGLFECLDRADEGTGKKLYIDGFSRNKEKRALVPNKLFFASETAVDLSGAEAYGSAKFNNAKVRGLLNILHAYNFTIEENTPIDEEIALDPELLGKVFENLLASYNEETKTTARKQTGSFYTPRPIVEYMVDESLKAHLTGVLTKLGRKEREAREQLDLLLGYTAEEHSLSEKEIQALLEAIHTCKILDPACGSGAFPMGVLQKLVHVLHKLDPENDGFESIQIREAQKIEDRDERRKRIEQIGRDFSENNVDYGRKLYLIENCLYGVDIQPIAIQITKLRFFISLVCDQKTNRDKAKNHGIRPLPNLETKFVAADTLIGLPIPEPELFIRSLIEPIEKEIEECYHRHFAVQNRKQKRDLTDKIKSLRLKLADTIVNGLGAGKNAEVIKKAKHIAEWDPFDPQTSADFFDPHWMFGRSLKDGFDVVIQNPPYISHEKLSAAAKAAVAKYDCWEPFADIYCYFIERAMHLLRTGGVSCSITSNSFLRADYGGPLRRLASKSCGVYSLISIDKSQVFTNAIVNIAILLLSKGANRAPSGSYLGSRAPWESGSFEDHMAANSYECANSSLLRGVWSLSTNHELKLLTQIESGNKSLAQRNAKIRLGLATGSNDAFLVSREKKDQFVSADATNETILKPVIRGRGVDRYQLAPIDQFLILSKNGVNLPRDFPLLANHLKSFGSRFLSRGAQGQNWWNLRACSFYEDFEQDRVVWIEMTHSPRFAVCPAGVYMLNTAYFLLPPPEWRAYALVALLNSSISAFFMRHSAQTSGMGVTRWFKEHVSQIPLPASAQPVETILFALGMLRTRTANAEAAFLEDLIDACVMECYFREHMAERDLLFHDTVAPHLAAYAPEASAAEQCDFLTHLHQTLNAPSHPIRNRLLRLTADSPDLLAVIKQEGKG